MMSKYNKYAALRRQNGEFYESEKMCRIPHDGFSQCITLYTYIYSPQNESVSITGIYFDTVVTIEAWGAEKEVLDHCGELCEYYEHLFSRTLPDSEVSEINRSGGRPVTVSEETADLIRTGLKYGSISNGYFDITIASASELWNFTDDDEKLLPDPDALPRRYSH